MGATPGQSARLCVGADGGASLPGVEALGHIACSRDNHRVVVVILWDMLGPLVAVLDLLQRVREERVHELRHILLAQLEGLQGGHAAPGHRGR